MLHLALRMAAHRITALLAVACAVLGGAALLTTTGVLAESGLRSQLPPGRLGGADVVVAADRSSTRAGTCRSHCPNGPPSRPGSSTGWPPCPASPRPSATSASRRRSSTGADGPSPSRRTR